MNRIVFACALCLLFLTSSSSQHPPAKTDASALKPKRKLDADLSGFDVSADKSDKKVATVLGGSRSAAAPSAILLAPHRAKLYGSSALFSWSFAGHNEGYVVIITDEDEAQLVHQQVKEPRYRLDSAKAKLQPGETYYWRVQVLPNTLASDPLEFVVISPQERQEIEKAIVAIPLGDSFDSALARARVLVDHRLWFDALGAYDDLIAKYPNRAELYDDRATIYTQIPATKALADADRAHAAELAKK
jgi:Domain of Unknown Function (DUF928)